MTENGNELPPIRIAFILDNVVADVLYTDNRLAAIFLSNPIIMDITDREDADFIRTNSTYDPETQTFTTAEPERLESFPIMPEDVLTVEDDDDGTRF
jgi:hypothetical protein